MPLYDVLLMAKSNVARREVMELVKGVASQVLAKEGVVTNVKSYGRVLLAYEIKKRDGWHKEANLMQLTVMAPPSLGKEILYLNTDDRLLRWMIRHHRGTEWMKVTATN